MDWPRLHYLAAVDRETRMSSAKPANKGIDFVCPSKEWKGLKVCRDGDEGHTDLKPAPTGWLQHNG